MRVDDMANSIYQAPDYGDGGRGGGEFVPSDEDARPGARVHVGRWEGRAAGATGKRRPLVKPGGGRGQGGASAGAGVGGSVRGADGFARKMVTEAGTTTATETVHATASETGTTSAAKGGSSVAAVAGSVAAPAAAAAASVASATSVAATATGAVTQKPTETGRKQASEAGSQAITDFFAKGTNASAQPSTEVEATVDVPEDMFAKADTDPSTEVVAHVSEPDDLLDGVEYRPPTAPFVHAAWVDPGNIHEDRWQSRAVWGDGGRADQRNEEAGLYSTFRFNCHLGCFLPDILFNPRLDAGRRLRDLWVLTPPQCVMRDWVTTPSQQIPTLPTTVFCP
jgi:hypothetical protein